MNAIDYWYQKAMKLQKALEVYADSNNPYWIERTKEANGSLVYYMKDIKQLEVLAKETLEATKAKGK